MKHTPEPWVQWESQPDVFGGDVTKNDECTITGGMRIADFACDEEDDQPGVANAARACACVNALAGVAEPEAAMAKVRALLAEETDYHSVNETMADGHDMPESAKYHRDCRVKFAAALALLTPAPSPDAAPAEEK